MGEEDHDEKGLLGIILEEGKFKGDQTEQVRFSAEMAHHLNYQ